MPRGPPLPGATATQHQVQLLGRFGDTGLVTISKLAPQARLAVTQGDRIQNLPTANCRTRPVRNNMHTVAVGVLASRDRS